MIFLEVGAVLGVREIEASVFDLEGVEIEVHDLLFEAGGIPLGLSSKARLLRVHGHQGRGSCDDEGCGGEGGDQSFHGRTSLKREEEWKERNKPGKCAHVQGIYRSSLEKVLEYDAHLCKEFAELHWKICGVNGSMS